MAYKQGSSTMPKSTGNFLFSIRDWSIRETNGKSIVSPIYQMNDGRSQWSIEVFPYGRQELLTSVSIDAPDEGSGDQVKVKPQRGKVAVAVHNQSAEGKKAIVNVTILRKNISTGPNEATASHLIEDLVFSTHGVHTFGPMCESSQQAIEAVGDEQINRSWFIDDMLSYEELTNNLNGYCVNDVVCFTANITEIGNENLKIEETDWLEQSVDPLLNKSPQSTLAFSSYASSPRAAGTGGTGNGSIFLVQDLSKMIDNKLASDISLAAGAVTMQSHKFILAARSKVFAKHFKQTFFGVKSIFAGGVFKVDIDPASLKDFVHYLYTDTFHSEVMTFSNLVALLRASYKYQISGLIIDCEASLVRHFLGIQSAAYLLKLANDTQAEHLHRSCISFISENIREVKATKEWENLDGELCREIIAVSLNPASLDSSEDVSPKDSFDVEEMRIQQEVEKLQLKSLARSSSQPDTFLL